MLRTLERIFKNPCPFRSQMTHSSPFFVSYFPDQSGTHAACLRIIRANSRVNEKASAETKSAMSIGNTSDKISQLRNSLLIAVLQRQCAVPSLLHVVPEPLFGQRQWRDRPEPVFEVGVEDALSKVAL